MKKLLIIGCLALGFGINSRASYAAEHEITVTNVVDDVGVSNSDCFEFSAMEVEDISFEVICYDIFLVSNDSDFVAIESFVLYTNSLAEGVPPDLVGNRGIKVRKCNYLRYHDNLFRTLCNSRLKNKLITANRSKFIDRHRRCRIVTVSQ